MSEHKVCKGCIWNHYPECYGTIMDSEKYMKIDKLKPDFECGQKDLDGITDFSIKTKSDLELRMEEVETKILELEAKTAEKL